MFDAVRRDFDHYRSRGPYTHLGFWVGAAYRASAVCNDVKSPSARTALSLATGIANGAIRFVRSVNIPSRTRIGPGLCLHHPQNVEISEHAVIGEDCSIYQDVVIAEGPVPGAPRLGDRVTVFAGAKILGGVTVGDDVEVGANAVVVRDVAANSVVAGPTGRAIPRATIERMRGL
jgi:serine O-acetyltransferase